MKNSLARKANGGAESSAGTYPAASEARMKEPGRAGPSTPESFILCQTVRCPVVVAIRLKGGVYYLARDGEVRASRPCSRCRNRGARRSLKIAAEIEAGRAS